MVSLVLYFLFIMHFDSSGSATTTTNLLGTSFLLTMVGGFISDTYMNRLNTCILFGIIQLMGYILLVIQSHDEKLQPELCGEPRCVHGKKALLFCASIYLIALGACGIRGCVRTLGADQFDNKNPKVLVVAVKNWSLKVPKNSEELYEMQSHESTLKKKLIRHTNQFRVLDRAAVLPEGTEARKWKVCTVTQVEEVKILTRMMPILLSTIIMNTCLAQLQTFSIQQGTGTFNIPPSSIPVIPLVFMTLLIPVYEFAFVPLVRRITDHPNGISDLERVGVGLVLSAISMVIEVKRKHEFNDHNTPIV
ncbi:protein NRT1/ PTR FAMILY 4.3-like [Gastrolobium bilobum]|uniref:protein NRT1/ PTR FAMILY 4.3-like n=1 Tax=Gastrolobium bilobum TaxID=150636 RepID=UPI002AB2A5D7|nr:protein NRT1/ PTR FAMILY 4.3-like [Gastrolobium bilobum]